MMCISFRPDMRVNEPQEPLKVGNGGIGQCGGNRWIVAIEQEGKCFFGILLCARCLYVREPHLKVIKPFGEIEKQEHRKRPSRLVRSRRGPMRSLPLLRYLEKSLAALCVQIDTLRHTNHTVELVLVGRLFGRDKPQQDGLGSRMDGRWASPEVVHEG